MMELLPAIQHAALGEVIKQVLASAVAWAKGRRKPASGVINKKLLELADKNLPQTIPLEDRGTATLAIVELAKPTFEDIVKYDTKLQRLITSAQKATVKKAAPRTVVKKAVKKAFKKVAKKSAKKSVRR